MEFSANQIAGLVNGTVEGDGNVMVHTFAKIEEGHKGAISFLANPKYEQYIYETEASVVLVSKDFVPSKPLKTTLLRVDNPYATIAQLLNMVGAMQQQRRGIENPVYVAEGVVLPENIYLGAFSYISKGATIGENVKIYLKEHPEVMDKIEGMLLDQIKKDEDFVPEPDIPEEDISEIMDMFVDDDGVVIE